MDEKIRRFIAIELSTELLQFIEGFTDQALREYSKDFRWVKTENLHLTLKFLGDTPINSIEVVNLTLNTIAAKMNPFPLKIGGTGAFPTWDRARTIWIGLQPSTELQTLVKTVELSLADIGFPSDNKKFSPHLTLCRVSDYAEPAKVKKLKMYMQSCTIPDDLSWTANRVTLFKSVLKPEGPVYSVLSEHLFKK